MLYIIMTRKLSFFTSCLITDVLGSTYRLLHSLFFAAGFRKSTTLPVYTIKNSTQAVFRCNYLLRAGCEQSILFEESVTGIGITGYFQAHLVTYSHQHLPECPVYNLTV